jgi:hypothetical protein
MDLVIARDEGIISIDNQPLAVDTSLVPSNVSVVIYDCTAGAGNMEYNDRLRLLEPFIDVTPYVSFVNAWLTAAINQITLAQAKLVKIGLIEGIFNSKRQLPITVLGYTWDATDQSLLGMQAAITAWDVASAVTTADATFSANVNAMTVVTPSTPAAANAVTPATSSIPNILLVNPDGQHDTSWAWQSAGPGVTGVSGGDLTQQPNATMQKSPINAPPVIAGPPIDWPPLNSTVMVRLTMAQMRQLIWSILWRRTQLQATRVTKTNTINGLDKVASVITYDVTTGWDTVDAPAPPVGTISGGGIIDIGGGGGGGPLVILVTRAGPWQTGGYANWDGYTVAVAIAASALTMLDGGAKTRLVLEGFNFSFAKCYIGPRVPQSTGQSPEKAYTPNPDPAGLVQVTFNGQPGGRIAAISGNSGTLTSDDLPQAIDGTNGIVVYLVAIASGSGSADWGTGAFGFDTWYTFGDHALDPNRRPGGSPYTHYGAFPVSVYLVQSIYTAAGFYPRLPPMNFVQGSSGWGGYTIAISIDANKISPVIGGNKTKISVQGFGPFTFDKCYIGPRAFSHPFGFEMVSTSQLFFNNGNAGAFVGVGQTLFSDELAHGIDATNGIVIRFHATAGGIYTTNGGTPGFNSYYLLGDLASQVTGGNWNLTQSSAYLVTQIFGSYPAAT